MVPRPLPIMSLLAATAVVAAGCSAIHTKTPEGKAVVMDQKDFEVYVEQVFRHHNSVVDQLLFAADTPSDRNSPLGQAEAKMAFACLPLNEVVSSSALGQSTSFWARMHLSESVPDCEAATRQVEQLISPEK